MALPTKADYDLSAIDDLHAVLMVKLRVWLRSPKRDARGVIEAMKAQDEAVLDFLNANDSE
jgi:hypothetical protein